MNETFEGIIRLKREKDKKGRKTKKAEKLASKAREGGSRGTRTRRRTNGGSLSSRGSATGMQCGLCAVVAGLFRRAMCIAGSRRGSGESCYQELTDAEGRRHSQIAPIETGLTAAEIAEHVIEAVEAVEEVRLPLPPTYLSTLTSYFPLFFLRPIVSWFLCNVSTERMWIYVRVI